LGVVDSRSQSGLAPPAATNSTFEAASEAETASLHVIS
jgi:hypothetical protein